MVAEMEVEMTSDMNKMLKCLLSATFCEGVEPVKHQSLDTQAVVETASASDYIVRNDYNLA